MVYCDSAAKNWDLSTHAMIPKKHCCKQRSSIAHRWRSKPTMVSGQSAVPGLATQPSLPWLNRYPKDVDWHMQFTADPLYRLMDLAVANHGSATATNFLGKTMTYAEIGRLVDRATAGLQALGVGRGSKVGLFLPNTPTYIIYYFAILRTGATVVNFNPLYSHEELIFQVQDSQTDLMITLDLVALFGKIEKLLVEGHLQRALVCSFSGLLPSAKSVLFRLFKSKEIAHPAKSAASGKILAEATLLANDGAYKKVAVNPKEDIAVLQYTGGTTGTPKGAMLTHYNLSANMQQIMAWCGGLEPTKEKIIGILPFFHVFAMTGVMNLGIATAAEIIMMPRFVLNDALKLIAATRPTIMPAVPTVLNAMLNHPAIKSFDLSSLKFCLSGGAPLPLEVKTEFEKLTGCKVVEAYGLSETSPGATFNPFDGPVKDGSIGQPLPGTTVSIRAVDDTSKEMPLGQEGEICIKGPQVMKGYWNKTEETANVFHDGYLRTGDVGRMDDEGFIFITDRIKDMIICSGFKVFPRHLEEKIYQHPAVEEVTVIGIKDSYRGEAPKAFIKLKAGMTATGADILKFLEPKLSKLEMPSQIEFRDALPKTMIGKLSKKELKQEEAARQRA
jgi:long-chain acyl-CoA synthetase